MWLNPMDIGREAKAFLLDAPLLPSGFFGTSTEAVVEKFREVKEQCAAFQDVHSLPPKSSSNPVDLRIIDRIKRLAWSLAVLLSLGVGS